MLREGDELLEVNGVPVMGRSTDEIVRLMVSIYYTSSVILGECIALWGECEGIVAPHAVL